MLMSSFSPLEGTDSFWKESVQESLKHGNIFSILGVQIVGLFKEAGPDKILSRLFWTAFRHTWH